MPDYLSPGVYIQELEGPAPIVGVSTSIAAFVGMAERGPVNVPILCTGPGDYTRWFGGLMVRDEFADPFDLDRAHCYLPYAVAGFFTNAGQIAYVTRVLPPEATYAQEILFDRGISTSVTSTLMRNAAIGDGLGNSPATGALIVLSPPPTSGWFRLDTGSVSEYLEIVGAPTLVEDAAALDLPLQLSHLAGADAWVYPSNPIAPAGEALVSDVGVGATVLFLQSTDALDTALLGWLLELTANGVSSLCVPTQITKTGTTSTGAYLFAITLALPLIAAFSSTAGATTVARLQPDIVAAQKVTLDVAASGGDLIIYASTGPTLDPGMIIDFEYATPLREARNIGQLCQLALAEPVSVDWPAGTRLAPYAPGAANSVTVNAAATTLSLTLASRLGVTAGSVLLVGASPTQESVTVQMIVPTATTTGLNPGAVTLTAPLQYPHNSGDAVVLISTTVTTAAVAAGTQGLSLGSRAGLAAGSVVQIGTAPLQEYAMVLAVQGVRALVGPDPGGVVLSAPLANAYPSGAGVAQVFLSPAAGAASSTVIDLPAGPDATNPLVTQSGWTADGIVQATLPDGTLLYAVIASSADAALSQVTVSAPVQNTHPMGSIVVGRDALIQIQVLDAGAWGDRVALAAQDESPGLVARAQVLSLIGPNQLKLATLTGVQPGSYLELLASDAVTVVDPTTPLKVAAVNLSTGAITLDLPVSGLQAAAIGAATAKAPVTLRSREFSITVNLYRHPDPAVPSRNTQVIQTEVFHNLSMDPRHSQYFQTVIGAINGPLRLSDNRPEGSSWLIRTQDTPTTQATLQAPRLGPEVLVDILPNGLQQPAQHKLQGGDDSMATVDDDLYVGADADDPRDRTGIFTLLNVPQISIVAIPGQGTPVIQAALISHCENALYRFAVLDAQYPDSAIADIQAQRQSFDSKFAALYYPWLTIPDPMPTNLAVVSDFPLPPSGHVVGIYARVDDARGVFKAPANEVVQGITGLTRTLVKGDQDVLNPSPTNINVIRDFRPDGRGIRVWGARVITSDDNYKYVPVKRLMMFIEQSLDVGLQDIVFEPNAPQLWASVERLIGNFLTTVWSSGGLQGDTADQSFFVRCDLTTMTQDNIDNGQLIALVGVAPVQPVEFVIIQVTLNMTSSTSS